MMENTHSHHVRPNNHCSLEALGNGMTLHLHSLEICMISKNKLLMQLKLASTKMLNNYSSALIKIATFPSLIWEHVKGNNNAIGIEKCN